MDWEGLCYVFGIPFTYFVLDFSIRRIIKGKRLDFVEYCYGTDFGLTGITTGIAGIAVIQIQPQDKIRAALILFISLICFILPILFHCVGEPMLESDRRFDRALARLLLAGVANITGIGGMMAGLWLIWLMQVK